MNYQNCLILVKVRIYVLYTRQCQGYCLMEAWSPHAPPIYLWATKMWNKKQKQAHKTMILGLTHTKWKQNSPLILHLWNKTRKHLVISRSKKYLRQKKVNRQALVLRKCSSSFLSQKMESNEFNSFRKTINNKNKAFSPALEMLCHYCM